jgi:hypothetical protein
MSLPSVGVLLGLDEGVELIVDGMTSQMHGAVVQMSPADAPPIALGPFEVRISTLIIFAPFGMKIRAQPFTTPVSMEKEHPP